MTLQDRLTKYNIAVVSAHKKNEGVEIWDAEQVAIDQALASIKKDLLAIIGEDEIPATQEFGLDPQEVFMPSDLIRECRNQLRAEQRERLERYIGSK